MSHSDRPKLPQGKEIIEYFIEQLSKEGITHIPRWEEPKPEKSIVAKERNKEEGESSSEEAETRDRTSSTPSTGSRELQLGASATNILSIEKVNINDGKLLLWPLVCLCCSFLTRVLRKKQSLLFMLFLLSATYTVFPKEDIDNVLQQET